MEEWKHYLEEYFRGKGMRDIIRLSNGISSKNMEPGEEASYSVMKVDKTAADLGIVYGIVFVDDCHVVQENVPELKKENRGSTDKISRQLHHPARFHDQRRQDRQW